MSILPERKPQTFHEPLLPLAFGVASGVLFGNAFLLEEGTAWACGALCAALWLLARAKNGVVGQWVAGVAFFFFLAAGRFDAVEGRPLPFAEVNPRELVAVEGCVVDEAQQDERRQRFVLEVAPEARLRLSYFPREDAAPLDFSYGDRVRTLARVRDIRNNGNPNVFDAERYYGHRRIYWTATSSGGERPEKIGEGCGTSAGYAYFGARTWVRHRLNQLSGQNSYVETILAALILGDSSRLPQATKDGFRQTGTYHALVISGSHISLIAGIALALLRVFLLPRWLHLCLAAALVALYAVLSGLGAPVARATIGFALFLLARGLYRRPQPINMLAGAAIVILLIDPAQLFEGSFLLSFLAVAALAALAGPLDDRLHRPWRIAANRFDTPAYSLLHQPEAAELRLELKLATDAIARLLHWPVNKVRAATRLGIGFTMTAANALLLTLVMLVGLGLPSVLFFHRISLVGLLANIPVVFLLSVLVSVALAGIVVGPVVSPVLSWLALTAQKTVDWHLRWDPGLRVPDPPLWLGAMLVASLLLLAWQLRRSQQVPALGTTAVVAAFLLLVYHPWDRWPNLETGKLELTALDVGQGDSLFLAGPDGHLALLDGGGFPMSKFDPGEAMVSPYLWSRQIGHLDTLIVSHGDHDHAGGLLAVYDNFRPREVWASCRVTGPLWDALQKKAGPRVRRLKAGDRVSLGVTQVEVLWPSCEVEGEGEAMKSNNASLVLRVQHGKHRFVLTGDIEASAELAMLEQGALSEVDVLKVAHHGSKSSTTEAWLEATKPDIALISAGYANGFGHPHPSVLARLAAHRAQILRTDELGQVRVLSDGQRLEVRPHRYWASSVSPWWAIAPAVE